MDKCKAGIEEKEEAVNAELAISNTQWYRGSEEHKSHENKQRNGTAEAADTY